MSWANRRQNKDLFSETKEMEQEGWQGQAIYYDSAHAMLQIWLVSVVQHISYEMCADKSMEMA